MIEYVSIHIGWIRNRYLYLNASIYEFDCVFFSSCTPSYLKQKVQVWQKRNCSSFFCFKQDFMCRYSDYYGKSKQVSALRFTLDCKKLQQRIWINTKYFSLPERHLWLLCSETNILNILSDQGNYNYSKIHFKLIVDHKVFDIWNLSENKNTLWHKIYFLD